MSMKDQTTTSAKRAGPSNLASDLPKGARRAVTCRRHPVSIPLAGPQFVCPDLRLLNRHQTWHQATRRAAQVTCREDSLRCGTSPANRSSARSRAIGGVRRG